jgi:TolB-like protein
MNDHIKLVSDECGAELQAVDVGQSLKQLLSSREFAQAPRMSKLLSFLVEKKLDGMERELTEYTIGLEVFRRDARVYNTALDPVVRVQVGRLRARLAAYYAALANPPEIQISVPMGNYVPVFKPSGVVPPSFRYKMLQVAPLRNLSAEQGGSAFVSGLDEELGSRLFQSFGNAIELREARADGQSGGANDSAPPHRLEGSVRVEQQHVRASMRLVDTGAGQIAWLSKFDFRGNLCMSLQEKLASAICAELERYLVSV